MGRGVFLPTGLMPLPRTFLKILFLEIALFDAFWGISKSLYSYVCVPFSYPQMKFVLVHGLDRMIKAY